MKIAISIDCGKTAWYYKALGISRALTAAGHDCYLWFIDQKSEYDFFDELEPDIFIGQTYRITDALIECIKERPFLKVLMKAADWGNEIDTQQFPVLVASNEEVKNVQRLVNETGKPDFLFIHYHPDYLDKTHYKWNTLGLKTYSIMNGADVFSFTKGVPKPEYECDIMFLGGYWNYKSEVLSKWLLPLCSDFKYKIKIFGNSNWPCPQYCGFLPEGEEANALASAKICINLHEPHSQVYGYDVVERPFKLASNKCFMLSDSVTGLEKSFNKSYKNRVLNTYKTPQDMHSDISLFLLDWDNYSAFIKDSKESLYKEVIEKHTYFDRAADIFKYLTMSNEQENMLQKKKEVFEKIGL